MIASNDNRTLLTVTELCARWGVARRTIMERISNNTLPAVRFGLRTWRIPIHAVEAIERSADARLSG